MALKIGLIGGGGDAWNHLVAHVHNQRVGTVTLAESDEAAVGRLRERFGIIKQVVTDYQVLLTDPEIAVVDLCLPPAQQEPVALAALTAGKHVLCSAPPVSTAESAEALAQAATTANRQLLCVLYQRFLPAHVKAREILTEALGETPRCGSISVQGGEYESERFHALDTLQSFLGPVCAVTGLCRSDETGRPDAEVLSLEFAGGALGQFTWLASAEERPLAERRLVGAAGTILIRDNPEDELPLVVLQAEGFFPVKVKTPPEGQEFATIAALEHYLAAIEDGHTLADNWPAATAALQARLAAETAMRERRTVVLSGA